ncbi:MAG: restriction endonuclease subunit S [Flavobacteriales bacterium]|nr:restriction endonuclease subunit S [Flavobacteriales bacterium]
MMVKLGEVCEQLRGVSYDKSQVRDDAAPGYVPVLRANNIQDAGVHFEDLVYVPRDVVKDKQLLRAGDIVIAASSGSKEVVGKAAQVKEAQEASFGAFCKLLRPNDRVDTSYFAHFFNTPDYRRKISALSEGANINNLKNEHLNDLDFPLPPLPTQRRIAAVLDKAQALVANDKRTLALYDQLAKSLFLEMFGDPVRNERGWETKSFETVVAQDCPLTYGIVQPGDEVEDGVPIVRPVDLTQKYLQVGTLKRVAPSIARSFMRTQLKGNELLLSVRGSVGAMSYATPELKGANVTRGIVPVWMDREQLSNEFVYHLFLNSSFSADLSRMAKGATLLQVNLGELREMPIIVPPLDLVDRFDIAMRQLELQQERAAFSLRQSEGLFGSLLQGAFAGGLG